MISAAIKKASDSVNSTKSAKQFQEWIGALKGLPKNAFGDAKAAADFGKEAAKAAATGQKAEAEAAEHQFKEAHDTYRKAFDCADDAEERERIREDMRRSEQRADEAARRRLESNERILKKAFNTVSVVAVGVVGLGLATAAVALGKSDS